MKREVLLHTLEENSHEISKESESRPYPHRAEMTRLIKSETDQPFSETPLIGALRAGTPQDMLSKITSCELEVAVLMMVHGMPFTDEQLKCLRFECDQVKQDQPVCISNGLVVLAFSLPELRTVIDLGSPEGRLGLVQWWMTEGRGKADFDGIMAAGMYTEPSPYVEQDQALIITRGLHALALSLPELHTVIDLGSPEGRLGLVQWWMTEGRGKADFDGIMAAGMYTEPSPYVKQDQALIITRGLHALALSLPELHTVIDLGSPEGRLGLVQWWMTEGRGKADFDGIVAAGMYTETSPFFLDAPPLISREAHALWLSRIDLQHTFDINVLSHRHALNEWYLAYVEDGIDKFSSVRRPLVKTIVSMDVDLCSPGEFLNGGVNILGYGRGEFGIGEDVRMAFQACEAVGVDACVPRLPLRIAARQNDLSVARVEVNFPRYNTNLICLPFFETLRLLASTRETILDRRYNIAFWQWELPLFPHAMNCVFDLVDEVWSFSRFTATAMRTATEKPVFQMPVVVQLPESLRKWERRDFGLPENTFIFLTVLDGNSSLKRKNPIATVHAFLGAFPNEKRVRLVVKAMNVSEAQPDWKKIVELAARDDRISLIVEIMSKDKLIGLQRVCDSFVSLHRSEGFGRNIAEAMLLGKPVIVSDYSGNTDFTTCDTAFMVPGLLVPVKAGEYAFHEGQCWFDADVKSAAEQMRMCVEDVNLRNTIACAGRVYVEGVHSAKIVGNAYLHRLRMLSR